MKGLRMGGSKYSDMGGDKDLMPVMLADPSRDLKHNGKPGEAKINLSYNSMIMTRSGSVMTKESVKELREHHGYCLTCANEPIQLFEIKKSKINPLFRGKEAIDVMHESYNGICLKCNPMMDPNKILKRASLRSLNRDGSVRSLGSKGGSFRSNASRSRSSSPESIDEEPGTPGSVGSLGTPRLRAPRRGSRPGMRRTPLALPPSTPTAVQEEDLFADMPRQNEVMQNSHMSHQNELMVRQQIQPNDQVLSGGSQKSASLGSHLSNVPPALSKTPVDEFSMPDFSSGNANFKTHRKKKKKKKDKDKDDRRRTREVKPDLDEITEENSKNTFDSSTDLFQGFDANFETPAFPSNPTTTAPLASPNKHSRGQISNPSTPKLMNADRRLDNFPPNPPLSTPVTTDPFGKNSFGSDNDFFAKSPNEGFARQNSFPIFETNHAEANSSDPFSSEGSLSDSGDTWGTPGDEPVHLSSGTLNWPPPPSLTTNASVATTPSLDSEQTEKTINFGRMQFGSDDNSSFLDPPSQTSSAHHAVYRSQKNAPSEPSEQSIDLQDAILQISRSDDFTNSMSPSQLIQADEMLMSGIKAEAAAEATSSLPTNQDEVEEVAALLDDVAAAGVSEILIDMLAGTIRENRRSVQIQELCLKHIWDHSKFNEAHKAQIVEAGLGQDVINAMRGHPKAKKIQEYGCGSIWSLSVNQNNRILLGRAGAVKLLFRALEEFIDDEETLETVFGALRTLSPEKEIRDAIVPLLGARRVCRAMALHRSSTTVQRDGCAFLSNIAVDMENQTVFVVTVKEIESVVRALGDHLRNESVVSSACFALKNYTYEEKNLRNLRRFEDVSSLLEDASKYSTKAEIRVDADEIRERLRLLIEEDDALEAIALSSLLEAMENPQLKVDEAVANFIDVMKQYPWSEKLICYSISSLLSLSRQSEEYLSRIAQFDVLKILVHVLYKSDSAAIQERGCETLKFLAEQGNRPRTMICDVDGSSVLIAALRQHYNNEKVKAVATGALEELSKDPRCGHLIARELSAMKDQVDLGSSIPGLTASFAGLTDSSWSSLQYS